MKKMFCCSNVMWGMLLVVIGLVILLNAVFNLHIPVFKIVFALFFVFLGIKMLLGTGRSDRCFFSSRVYTKDDTGEESSRCYFSHDGVCSSTKTFKDGEYVKHKVVFGKKIVDLTALEPADRSKYIEIDVTFGEMIVKIDSRMPVALTVNASFGSVSLPESAHLIFDKNTYRTASYDNAPYKIDAVVNVTFGSVHIIDINK